MWKNNATELLKIEYPIVQAPMAGGITTSELVAAVSNHGGLGMIGAGYMTPIQMRDQIREARQLTSHSFGVNLFVPNEFKTDKNAIDSADRLLQPIHEQLNAPLNDTAALPDYKDILETFHDQIKIVIAEKVPICSFTFGIPCKEVIAELKEHNVMLIGTATTVREAVEIERNGMDMVVVQGSEAGGHRGTFINGYQESLVGLMSLVPQVVNHVSIPVIAAGGIMDGRGLMASICLGAEAVQMGTAFLTCAESGAHKVYKEAILHATEDETVLTRAFSGKWARGIQNKFILEMQTHEASYPDFPVQNTLTQAIRKASSLQNNQDYIPLWSGQSPRLAKNQTVEALIQHVMAEAEKMKGNIFT